MWQLLSTVKQRYRLSVWSGLKEDWLLRPQFHFLRKLGGILLWVGLRSTFRHQEVYSPLHDNSAVDSSSSTRPQVFWVNSVIICNFSALLTSSVQYGKILANLVPTVWWIMNYVCDFSQSETKKYFEWIIIKFTPDSCMCQGLRWGRSPKNFFEAWLTNGSVLFFVNTCDF